MAARITVVGAGVSGTALARFAARKGYSVFVTDRAAKLPDSARTVFEKDSIEYECGTHSSRCLECGLMVVSSGVGEKSDAVLMARQAGIPVCGELDFLSPFFRGKIIAVTGTNGKTTTTSLIAHLLKSAGLNACAAGNIGDPLASHADEELDAIVMELSSFMLHWNTRFAPDVSILTNLAPDHIDWHGSYEKYAEDKCRIFLPRKGACYAITQACDAERVPDGRIGYSLYSGSECYIDTQGESVVLVTGKERKHLFEKSSLPLLGVHNLENAAMAAAAVALAFPDVDPAAGLSEFKAPRHRCEKVCEKGGVLYIDDSKGTNVAAVITALYSIDGTKVVILGGQGKGESYGGLAEAVKRTARAAVVLGSEAEKICEALKASGCENVYRVKDMSEAVMTASSLAHPGDRVLLSPACTSWDMYRNYGERGDHFAQLVRELV